jgi:hypothetical protein
VTIPEIKEGNAGAVRRRVNEALKERGITYLGVNSKGNGRYSASLLGQGLTDEYSVYSRRGLCVKTGQLRVELIALKVV